MFFSLSLLSSFDGDHISIIIKSPHPKTSQNPVYLNGRNIDDEFTEGDKTNEISSSGTYPDLFNDWIS